MLVDVSFEQWPQFALFVDSSSGGWDLDLQENVVGTMDALRPLLTVLTQVIIGTIAENVNSKISSISNIYILYCDRPTISIHNIAALVEFSHDLPTLVSCPFNYGITPITRDVVVDSIGGKETNNGGGASGWSQHLHCSL